MPKEFTHWTIAEKARQKLEHSPLKDLLEKYRCAYNIGAVLPDLPYYSFLHHKYKLILPYGESVHRIRPFSPYCGLKGRYENITPAQKACLAGAFTHLCTDAFFHNFVFYYTGDVYSSAGAGAANIKHRHLETYLDLFYYNKIALFHDYSLKELVKKSETPKKELGAFMVKFFDAGHSRLNVGNLNSMLRSYAFAQNIIKRKAAYIVARSSSKLWRKFDVLKTAIYPELKPVNHNFFTERQSYRHPYLGTHYTENIADIEQKTVNFIAEVFERISAGFVEGNTDSVLTKEQEKYLDKLMSFNTGRPMKFLDKNHSVSDLMSQK